MPTWIRCRDRDTGHEFDLHEDDQRIADGSVEVIEGYEENSGLTAEPRPPKHYVDKAGKPSQPKQASAQGSAQATPSKNEKE